MSIARYSRFLAALGTRTIYHIIPKQSANYHSVRPFEIARNQLGCRLMGSATEDAVVNLTTKEVLEESKKGVCIIDVREQVEIHNTGLIPGAVNIPLGRLEEAMGMNPDDFKERYGFDKPGVSDRLIMSCQSGNRSRRATIALKKLGFTDVVNNCEGWLGYEEFIKPK